MDDEEIIQLFSQNNGGEPPNQLEASQETERLKIRRDI